MTLAHDGEAFASSPRVVADRRAGVATPLVAHARNFGSRLAQLRRDHLFESRRERRGCAPAASTLQRRNGNAGAADDIVEEAAGEGKKATDGFGQEGGGDAGHGGGVGAELD